MRGGVNIYAGAADCRTVGVGRASASTAGCSPRDLAVILVQLAVSCARISVGEVPVALGKRQARTP